MLISSVINNSGNEIPLFGEKLPENQQESQLENFSFPASKHKKHHCRPLGVRHMVQPPARYRNKAEKNKSFESLMKRAQVFLSVKDRRNAKKLFLEALDLNPEDKRALWSMACCCFSLKEYEESLIYSADALKRNYRDTNFLYIRALCFICLKLDEKAMKYLDLFLEKEPKHAQCLTYRLELCNKKMNNDIRTMAQILTENRTVSSELEEPFSFAILPPIVIGDHAGWPLHVDEQAALKSTSVWNALQNAQEHLEKGQYKLAIDDLLNVSKDLEDPSQIELLTKYKKVLCSIAGVVVEPREKDQVLKLLSMALEKDPQDITLLDHRIRFYSEKKCADEKTLNELNNPETVAQTQPS